MATKQTNTIITARASHTLTSPRKANLILGSLRGQTANFALAKLELLPHKAARIVGKVLKQAIANATSNYSANSESLIIDTAFATKGRVLKRAHFGGRGHVKPYERTASHLTINLRLPKPKIAPPSVATKAELVHTTKPTAKKMTKQVKKTIITK